MTFLDRLQAQQDVVDAAQTWFARRDAFIAARTSGRATGREIEQLRQTSDAAMNALRDTLALVDVWPSRTTTTTGAARRVTELEGQIVLAAIGWLHARDGDGRHTSTYLAERYESVSDELAASARELVETLMAATGAAAR